MTTGHILTPISASVNWDSCPTENAPQRMSLLPSFSPTVSQSPCTARRRPLPTAILESTTSGLSAAAGNHRSALRAALTTLQAPLLALSGAQIQ
jgi:hypothetical protein